MFLLKKEDNENMELRFNETNLDLLKNKKHLED